MVKTTDPDFWKEVRHEITDSDVSVMSQELVGNGPDDLQAWLDIHARVNQVLGVVQYYSQKGEADEDDLAGIGVGLLSINDIVTNVIGGRT